MVYFGFLNPSTLDASGLEGGMKGSCIILCYLKLS